MKKIPIILFYIVLLNYSLLSQVQYDKNTVYKNLITKYGKINTIAVVLEESGNNLVLKAKRGNKYNISMSGINVISDGKTIWTYNPMIKNVVISNFVADMSGLTLDYFFFNVIEKLQPVALKTEVSTSKKKRLILELQAKDKNMEIQKVNLFINEKISNITAIEVTTKSNVQKWTIKNLDINKTMPDTLFLFKTPKGVEEIDMR
ncbi:Outer-membrane lipoprotein carrier protein [bioreactor metagenome]|uniref:Outer-membrane lipoprotein carrier protein n=1 Tax=bioreactor metagenome TaxID=1076179 RepID=A0A645GK41_9ZZZZ